MAHAPLAVTFCFFAGLGSATEGPCLCSSAMHESGGRPTHARRMFSMHERCLKSELTTGVPGGTIGALSMYERSESTGWNECHSDSPFFLYVMREASSARIARSRMSGVASRESSQLPTRGSGVLWPPRP